MGEGNQHRGVGEMPNTASSVCVGNEIVGANERQRVGSVCDAVVV